MEDKKEDLVIEAYSGILTFSALSALQNSGAFGHRGCIYTVEHIEWDGEKKRGKVAYRRVSSYSVVKG